MEGRKALPIFGGSPPSIRAAVQSGAPGGRVWILSANTGQHTELLPTTAYYLRHIGDQVNP